MIIDCKNKDYMLKAAFLIKKKKKNNNFGV